MTSHGTKLNLTTVYWLLALMMIPRGMASRILKMEDQKFSGTAAYVLSAMLNIQCSNLRAPQQLLPQSDRVDKVHANHSRAPIDMGPAVKSEKRLQK
jgi:hypothetical protein